jgi:succinoglycan biosynthesis transport protein ExoP
MATNEIALRRNVGPHIMTGSLIDETFRTRHTLVEEGLRPLGPRVLGPREIFGLLRRRKWMIGAIVAVGTLASLGAAFFLPRIYTATSTILLEKDDPNLLEEQPDTPVPQSVKTQMDTETDRMKSRNFAGRVVDDQKLIEDPDFNAFVQPQDVSFLDAIQEFIFGDEPQPKPAASMEVQRDQAINALLAAMTVTRNGESTAMSISIAADNPGKAARLANAVASLYVEWSRDLKLDSTRQATDFLRQQSNTLARNIAEREKEIAFFGSDKDVWTDPSDNLLQQAMQQMNEHLSGARADLAKAQSRIGQVQQRSDGSTIIDDTTLASGFLTTLRGQQADAMTRRSELTRNFGSNHPQVLAIEAQLDTISRSLAGETKRIVDALRGEVDIAQSNVDKIESQIEAANAGLRVRAPSEIRLRELNRDLLTEQKLYDVAYSRLGKLDPYDEMANPGARIISVAPTPTSPSFPKVKMLLLGGIVGSLVIALLTAMTLESVNGAVTDQRRIAQILRAPVLSSLTRRGWLRRRRTTATLRAILANKDVRLAARFRTLWDICSRRTAALSQVTIMVASVDRCTERSTISVGLAKAAAASGAHTLLLDLDTRHSGICEALRLARNDETIEELSFGECSLDQIVHPVLSVPGLAYAFSEKDRSRHGLFLTTREFDLLLENFRSVFDVIIVDAPPFMSAQDILPAASSVDGVLLALRYGVTLESTLVEMSHRFRFHDVPLLGAVVTDSESDQSTFMESPPVSQRRRVAA